MLFRLEIFPEVCAAVAAQVSLNRKPAEFPCFLGFNELPIAVRTFSHSDPFFQLLRVLIKRLARFCFNCLRILLSVGNDFKSSSTNIELGGYTSKEQTDRAERDRKEKADRTEKDRVKTARKVQEKAEKAEEDRVKTARKVQEKAEKDERDRVKTAKKVQEKAEKAEENRVKTASEVQGKADRVEKDRVESARQSDRARLFNEVLSQGTAHSKGCCEPCNFHIKTNDGEYQPCKLGHKDSGPNKEICADCTESRYHQKK